MAATDWTFAGGLTGKNTNVTSFTVLAQNGVRPNYSHLDNGAEIVFDYYDAAGYNKLAVMNTSGTVLRSLTDSSVVPSIAGQVSRRSSGNAQFSPNDTYIVYIEEAEKHFSDTTPANMGIGIFCNIKACTRNGLTHWKLTNIPIFVAGGLDAAPQSYGSVNPHFSEDGKYLVWTQHFGDDSRTLQWGLWQVMYAQWDTSLGYPRLLNPRPLYTPTTIPITDPYSGIASLQNSYVTAMAMYGSPTSTKLLLAQNALAVGPYGQDQCIYDLTTGVLTNWTNDAVHWMEDSCISPYPSPATAARNFVYMSNEIMPAATYPSGSTGSALDNLQPNWPYQPRQREWYYRKINDGSGKTQLTFFNDATAPEYVGRRVIVASCCIAPDGLSMVGTFGIDWNAGAVYVAGVASNVYPYTAISLKVIRLTFAAPI